MIRRKMMHRITNVFVCLCLIISMLGSSGLIPIVKAASESGQLTPNAVREADPDTMNDYKTTLLTDKSGSRYAGRVWTDKSVFAHEEKQTGDSD